ncbi:MAG: hypothetical protein NTV31_13710 [Bacteroidia bacterium]|nr:hypothetical protein [Bacteroidia bacterium]
METEITSNTPGRKKTFIILIIIFSVFIIYYTIMSILSPAQKLTSMKNESGAKPAENSVVDEHIFSDSTYLRLLKEKSFLQSRIAMAETDSIYLTINLADSSASIEISGVVVHKAKMSNMRISKFFANGNENVILSMLASPFTIANSFATIKKEPVMIKMAPKDTSEYKPDIMPDTSVTEPVNYILEMTNGTRIYVYQEEKDKFSYRMNYFNFNIKDRLRETWSSLKSVALFKVPEYHPYIKMRLPRADAKIIYRALPKNGQIAVFR